MNTTKQNLHSIYCRCSVYYSITLYPLHGEYSAEWNPYNWALKWMKLKEIVVSQNMPGVTVSFPSVRFCINGDHSQPYWDLKYCDLCDKQRRFLSLALSRRTNTLVSDLLTRTITLPSRPITSCYLFLIPLWHSLWSFYFTPYNHFTFCRLLCACSDSTTFL